MTSKEAFLLLLVGDMFAYVLVGWAALRQAVRLREWFVQWQPQLAMRELPVYGPRNLTYFLTQRAAQIFRPNAFLRRQRQRLVVLVIATLVLFVAYPLVGLLLVIFNAR